MMSNWRFLLGRFQRKLWARSALYCLAGIVTALIAAAVGHYWHLGKAEWLGTNAVRHLLSIMAASMLTVATFSLSTMVTAYAAASSSTTPRASQLLIEDNLAQRALSTFVGSFLFSIVGLIALSAGVYDAAGRVLLFAATLAMIGAVVGTLLAWIDSLPNFGRVANTIERVEAAAKTAIVSRAEHPHMGGVAAVEIPAGAQAVRADSVGFVRHVDVGELQELAEDGGLRVHLAALPGTFVDHNQPLAYIEGAADERTQERIVEAFIVGDSRTYEQDPRFGLIVLTEIAIRALSPAINDPGTAIQVIGTVVRLLSLSVDTRLKAEQKNAEDDDNQGKTRYPRVYVPEIEPHEYVDDVFNPIARDGASFFEVVIKLQRALSTLQKLGDERLAAASKRHAQQAMSRAEQAMTLASDFETLRQKVDALESA